MHSLNTDTIVAIATAPGRGGVGIVRISGPRCKEFAAKILKQNLSPRNAHYCDFFEASGGVIDKGIAIFFPNPHSFTGEDVLELQGHGGPVILDMLVAEVVNLGARLANPGEFSERAYLNDKLDLAQAEAVADLINASSRHAAKHALNSLQGEFSKKIQQLVDQLIHLRMYVESAIDFPEEEVDFLNDGHVESKLLKIIAHVDDILQQAQQGVLVREGMNVVIAGRPNAGKSSLLNALVDQDVAIVTNIAGTTRDVLKQHIHIDGMPLHVIDTAGLRDSPDTVEKIGMQRAWSEITTSDRILLVIDVTDVQQLDYQNHWKEFFNDKNLCKKLTVVFNKIDKINFNIQTDNTVEQLAISAKEKTGLSELKNHLKNVMGYQNTNEGGFSARRRHVDAIENAKKSLITGLTQLRQTAAGELLAEDLKYAQDYCNQITGEFTPDDLLGKIFGSFCIGK